MKQVQWFALATGSVTLAMVAAISPAEAAAIRYDLQGATITYPSGAGTQTGDLTGSFFFDSLTGLFSDIAINSPFTGGYVATSAPGSTASQLTLSKIVLGANATLTLNFANPLSGLGGDSVAILNTSSETVSGTIFGNPINQTATVNGGSVAVIPTPALLPGLVGLGLATRRKRKAALAAAKA